MIQVNELRTGNTLQYYIGEEGVEWEQTNIDLQDMLWCEERNENFNQVHKGVPLTNEIIEKCGFRYREMGDHAWFEQEGKYIHGNHSKFVGEHGVMAILHDSEGYSFPFHNSSIWRKLTYLHELQNLYYVMAGEELDSNCEDDFLNSKTLDTLNEETVTPHDANTMLADSMPLHKCKYCGIMTDMPDDTCYKAPKD